MRVTYLAYSPLDLQSANSIQTFHTCRALAALLGDRLTVVVPRFGRGEAKTPFRAVKIPRVPVNKLSRLVRSNAWSYLERTLYTWLACLYLFFKRADVVYCRDVIAAFWLVTFRFPVIYEVHDLESERRSHARTPWLTRLLRSVDERTLRGACAVVSLTQTFKDEVVRRGWQPAHRVFVIPDAYEAAVYYPRPAEEARVRLGLPSDALVVGYAGMTYAHRRLDLLLEALQIWNEPRARLVLLGGRPPEVQELAKQAQALGVGQQILWRGRQSAEATARDLSGADLLVIPDTVTDATASPLKMFEYLALGRAIVAVDRPSLREILTEGTACFFRPGDASDLARVLAALAGDPARRGEMARLGLARAGEFTYTRRAERIAACLAATVPSRG